MTAATGMNLRRIVVKAGSHLIAGSPGFVPELCRQIAGLLARRIEVILVSSGAIATGVGEFHRREKPRSIPDKQAFAAIGQPLLMTRYIEAMAAHRVRVAQVLLTRGDFDDRIRYLNIRLTLRRLLSLGVVPVINENDTVATDELRFGDNDTLSAIVAAKLDADALVILTDVPGVCERNPCEDPGAPVIPVVEGPERLEELYDRVGGRSRYFGGTGGMRAKLNAARIACLSGVLTIIADGTRPGVLLDIAAGDSVGTRFLPVARDINARKRWIAFGRRLRGVVVIDSGAVRAVRERNSSLLPGGVVAVRGDFSAGDAVSVQDEAGAEIARGIVRCDAGTLVRIKGKSTADARKCVPHLSRDEIIHRDDLALI